MLECFLPEREERASIHSLLTITVSRRESLVQWRTSDSADGHCSVRQPLVNIRNWAISFIRSGFLTDPSGQVVSRLAWLLQLNCAQVWMVYFGCWEWEMGFPWRQPEHFPLPANGAA